MRQYELWWAQMPEPIGRRPVLLLSRNPAYEYLTRVIVVEITSTIRNIPVEVSLGPAEGLRHRSVANFDNVRVVAKGRLLSRIGALKPRWVDEVKRALGFSLDWPELKASNPRGRTRCGGLSPRTWTIRSRRAGSQPSA